MPRTLIDAVTGKVICNSDGKVILYSDPEIPEKTLETANGDIFLTASNDYFVTK